MQESSGSKLAVLHTFHSFAWLPGLQSGPYPGTDPGVTLALYRSQVPQALAAGDARACRYLRYMAFQAYEEIGRYSECLALAQQLVEATDPAREPVWRALALALSAQAGLHGGWHGPALEQLAEAAELLDRHPDVRRDRGLASMAVAMGLQSAGAFDDAEAMLRELASSEPWAAIHFVSELVLLHLTRGAERRLIGEAARSDAHFAEAASLALRWRRVAQETGEREHVARSLVCEAYALGALGLTDAAVAVASGTCYDDLLVGRLERCLLDLHRGHAEQRAGRLGAARRSFRRASARSTRSDAAVWQATALVALARVEVAAHGPHPAEQVWSDLTVALLRRRGDQSRSFAAELEARRRARRLGVQQDRLSTQAMQDPLTGLGNRRALDRALDLAADAQEAVGACFVDIDHFKQVNDDFSHAFGDEVLRTVAELASAACRATDLLVRYGGDEFVVLVRDGADGTGPLAERIRRSVSGHPWARRAPGLSVTVSVGVAAPQAATDVIAAADAALLRAKQAGRNRAVLPAPPP